MNAVKRAAFAWAYPAIDGVRFRIPWDINEAQFGREHYRYAKGSLGEILTFTRANCPYRTPIEIHRWMRGNNPSDLHVGIDCSGLVYRVLDEAAAMSGAPGLEETLGSNAYNTDVDALTSSGVADPLSRAQDVQTGDVIRFNNGGHAGVVLDVATNPAGRVTEVWFIHSGLSGGPHIAWLEVRDPTEDIGHASTQWHEASERPWLVDNGLRDAYYERICHSRYYRGERGRSIKIGVAVTLNGRPLEFPVAPFARDGVALAMARPIADGLRADLIWTEPDQSIQFFWQGRSLKLQMATTTAWTNGGTFTLPAEPELIIDRAFIPVKALEQGLGVRVTWQPWPPTVRLAT